MNKLTSRFVAAAISLAFFVAVLAQESASFSAISQVNSANHQSLDSARFSEYPKPLPGMTGTLDFVPNQGQWPDEVVFRASGKSAVYWITENGIEHVLTRAVGDAPVRDAQTTIERYESKTEPQYFEFLKITFSFGQSTELSAYGLDTVDGRYVNFIRSDEPANWQIGVPVCKRVAIPSAFDKIDVQCYGSGGNLEYDFILAPGSDPDVISLKIEGATDVYIDHDGSLVCSTLWGDVRQKAPITYQRVGNMRPATSRRHSRSTAMVISVLRLWETITPHSR